MRKGLIKRLLLPLLAVAMFHPNLTAQNESDFYTPTSGGIQIDFVNDYNVNNNDFLDDDSEKLRQAIDDAAAAGGGTINIESGSYIFSGIKNIVSNIHIRIDKDAVIRPVVKSVDEKFSMFLIADQKATAENISITGVGGQYTIDLTHTPNTKIFVFSFKNVKNFKISDMYVKDNITEYQCVAFDPTKYDNTWYVPRNGVMKNCHADNCDFGYGTMQMQGGKNIYFENISCTGGIPLRLESGWDAFQGEANAIIDEIYARDIRCYDGQCAVFLCPHTMEQGYVDIRDVTVVSCEWGVKTENGYTTDAQAARGLTPGSFDESSIVANVRVTYGETAQIRGQSRGFVPCGLRDKIGPWRDIDRCHTPSPALAPVGDIAAKASKGVYQIRMWDIQHTGFKDIVPTIVNDSYDDYEDCADPTYNANPGTIAPRRYLYDFVTPNTAVAGQNLNLSVKYTAETNGDIYFSLLNNSNGNEVASVKTTVTTGSGTKSANLTVPSNLSQGTYIWKVRITATNNSEEDDQLFTSVSVNENNLNVAPTVSFNNISNGQNFSSPASVYVLVDANDSDGSVANVKLYLDGTFVRQEGLAPYEWNAAGQNDLALQNLVEGSYVLRAVATDNDGATSESSVTIIVGDAPTGNPVVTFASPLAGQSFNEPASVYVDVDATDSDGTVSNVKLYLDGTFVRQENVAPYEWNAAGQNDLSLASMSAGTYLLRAVATDNQGNTGEASISITVTGGQTTPATATVHSYSNQEAAQPALNILDGDYDDASRWSANGFPQWVVLDFGESVAISGTNVWTYQDRAYQYTVEASQSATLGYTTIVDRSANTSGAQPISNTFATVNARYVKLTVTGASGYTGTWSAITEFEVTAMKAAEQSYANRADNQVSIYPMPATNELNVLFGSEVEARLSLVNIAGQVVLSSTLNDTYTNIDIDGIKAGYYMAVIVDADGNTISKPVIIE